MIDFLIIVQNRVKGKCRIKSNPGSFLGEILLLPILEKKYQIGFDIDPFKYSSKMLHWIFLIFCNESK